MTNTDPPTTIGPAAYNAWRASLLGKITDAIEQRLILSMMGEMTGARILDAGCGDGILVCAIASHGAEVIGIDPDPTMLAAARLRAEKVGIRAIFVDGQVEALPFPDASFDVVVSVTVLCFIPKPASAIREMARVLKPGGRLVLGELGRWNTWAMIRRLRGWRGSPTWKAAHFRTETELRALTKEAGLVVSEVRGAVYYPPVALFARALTPFDRLFSSITTFGAAFIALMAVSPDQAARPQS